MCVCMYVCMYVCMHVCTRPTMHMCLYLSGNFVKHLIILKTSSQGSLTWQFDCSFIKVRQSDCNRRRIVGITEYSYSSLKASQRPQYMYSYIFIRSYFTPIAICKTTSFP